MDNPTSLSAASGRLVGSIIGLMMVIFGASFVLWRAWNQCVPQVFGLVEIEYRQAVAMTAIVWTVTLFASRGKAA